MNELNRFSNLYPLSKTLCFELKPIGDTLRYIRESGILDDDRHRADSYIKVKKIIDEYHKEFVSRVLSDFELKYDSTDGKDSLTEYYMYYKMKTRNEADKENFKTIQTNLRKQISSKLCKDEAFKRIDKKELIQNDLLEFVEDLPDNQEKKALIEEFKNFTTYFTGFHENRQNMYTSEEKSTAISYRLINENLPKFIDNIGVFEKLYGTEIIDKLPGLYSDFQEYMNVEDISDMFQLAFYSMVLTQEQIDVYNAIIGGKTLSDDVKIKGLNEYINLYNQQHKEAKLPKFKFLFKQILSDRNAISWLPEEFESDNQTLEAIKGCYDNLCLNVLGDNSLKLLLESLGEYDLTGIFLSNDLQLADISKKIFGHWNVIQKAIQMQIEKITPQKRNESYDEYQNRILKQFKNADSFSIEDINVCLRNCGVFIEGGVEKYFQNLGAIDSEMEQTEDVFNRIANAYEDIRDLLNNSYPEENNLAQDKMNVEKIKALLDALKNLQHFIKPLLGKGDEANKDEQFYGEFARLWDELDQITPLYNMVRNYVTQKPYSNEKIKLNFENSTLLDGWDVNKERDNSAVILRKDGLYYLGIMNKKYNKIFEEYPSDFNKACYEKMEYKLLPGANKMLPKVFFSKSRIDEFKPSAQLMEKYKNGTHKKGDNFSLHDCHALIDFFKSSIEKHEDWRQFCFQFSDTESYQGMSGFYREVEQQGYKLTFKNISAEYIDKQVSEGKLYLFQIYNKDFSPYAKGIPNMHTLYWKMLFDCQNLSNVVYKLNGQAEVFFRKSSIQCNYPTHPANQPIKNKNINNKKETSVFAYDLIKDRRYTVDKFQFHVPITMNYKASGLTNINGEVNNFIQNNEDIHVIGIDRGERHLLYLSLIDGRGRIKEQYSLNTIVNEYNGNTYATNYHDLLKHREDERLKARQSWQSIENIKELKEGYLSQVIHKISELVVKYNAIVVLEDLNFGFMRSRQKVEKQVYQKFEKMLIDKLNYLVDKKKDKDEYGGLLKAYQFTNKFESFQKMGKQSGFLFYVPAWNTSKIDPVTGFVNLLDLSYESISKSKLFFSKFDFIRYNASKNWFEFAINYDNFTQKAEGTKTYWTICTYGDRIETFRNIDKNSQWDSKTINLTDEFKTLFAEYGIDIQSNLKECISNQDDKRFFERLIHLLRLTLQMRNSVTGSEIDYLISPVADENGVFYDSRNCADSLPKNADANGAYNIARKGLWVVKQIREATDMKKLRLAISNKEWLSFAQNKPYLNC